MLACIREADEPRVAPPVIQLHGAVAGSHARVRRRPAQRALVGRWRIHDGCPTVAARSQPGRRVTRRLSYQLMGPRACASVHAAHIANICVRLLRVQRPCGLVIAVASLAPTRTQPKCERNAPAEELLRAFCTFTLAGYSTARARTLRCANSL